MSDGGKSDHRKVYMKGYFDGLAEKGDGMTPAKLEEKLRSQSNIAQKVYTVVPIKEAWSLSQINQALYRATRSQIDFNILGGCLNALREAGLIKQAQRNFYQRVEVKEKVEPKMTKEMKTQEADQTPVAASQKKALDTLAGIASHLRLIANDIEAAALAFEEEKKEATEGVAKLKQLQLLLKELA